MYYRMTNTKFARSFFFPENVSGRSSFTSLGLNEGGLPDSSTALADACVLCCILAGGPAATTLGAAVLYCVIEPIVGCTGNTSELPKLPAD
jgi:hypothetical protein